MLDGLGGVAAIDMLEIQENHALRYVASMARRYGTIDEDNYPVRRGTVMKLDDFTGLLWVHGVTACLGSSRRDSPISRKASSVRRVCSHRRGEAPSSRGRKR